MQYKHNRCSSVVIEQDICARERLRVRILPFTKHVNLIQNNSENDRAMDILI
jgi:hypothetical protein